MAGLVPAIHAVQLAPGRKRVHNGSFSYLKRGVDARDKPGHDVGLL